MSYSPSELTARDQIRGMAGDTTSPEWLADATYDAVLAKWGVPGSEWSSSPKFLRAAAELIRRVAVAIEQDVTSYTATGDFSASWGDRTRTLRALATQLESQAADIEQGEAAGWGGTIRFKSQFLTGSRGNEW